MPAFPSFSVARSSKTASETNFGHILSHAWPKNFDFVASEAIRNYFPSPTWFGSTRLEASEIHLDISNGRSRGSYSAFAGPWLKNAYVEVLNIYSLTFLGLQLGSNIPALRFPKLILGISRALDQKY